MDDFTPRQMALIDKVWRKTKAKLKVFKRQEEDMYVRCLDAIWRSPVDWYHPNIEAFLAQVMKWKIGTIVAEHQQMRVIKTCSDEYKDEYGTARNHCEDIGVSGEQQETIEYGEVYVAVHEAMHKLLTSIELQAMLLSAQGCTYDEICEETGWDKKRVDNAIARSRMKLRAYFHEHPLEEMGGTDFEPSPGQDDSEGTRANSFA